MLHKIQMLHRIHALHKTLLARRFRCRAWSRWLANKCLGCFPRSCRRRTCVGRTRRARPLCPIWRRSWLPIWRWPTAAAMWVDRLRQLRGLWPRLWLRIWPRLRPRLRPRLWLRWMPRLWRPAGRRCDQRRVGRLRPLLNASGIVGARRPRSQAGMRPPATLKISTLEIRNSYSDLRLLVQHDVQQ